MSAFTHALVAGVGWRERSTVGTGVGLILACKTSSLLFRVAFSRK